MSEIEALVEAYRAQLRLPWERSLAGARRVWFAVYDPAQERRLRLHLPEFEIATQQAQHGWSLVDLTDSFARWMAGHEYRESYFAEPELMELALADYAASVEQTLVAALEAPGGDEDTVVAVAGLASLFGLTRASPLIEAAAPHIRGRLLVFFPGHYEQNNYRLLDARDGWSYLATPIIPMRSKG